MFYHNFQFEEGNVSGLNYNQADLGKISSIFFHANGFNSHTYQQIFCGLDEDFMGIDMRGFGKTTLPTPYHRASWPYLADDMADTLRQLPQSQHGLHLAGHSMGATVALLLAEKYPQLVKKLTLIEPVMLPQYFNILCRIPGLNLLSYTNSFVRKALARQSEFTTKQEVAAQWQTRSLFKNWAPGILDDYMKDGLVTVKDKLALACPPRWEVACFRMQQYWPRKALRQVSAVSKIPVRILQCDKGSTLSKPALDFIKKYTPDVSITRKIHTSHFMPMEAPKLIRKFLM